MELVYIAIVAVILDALFGDPSWMPHPIVWIGKWISFCEKGLRRLLPSTPRGEFFGGILLWILVVGLSTALPAAILYGAWRWDSRAFLVLSVFWCWQILAARSLAEAGTRVQKEIQQENLPLARKYVSWIVGRDTSELDFRQITKATVETIAENTSDGVVAPLLYLVVGGAPLGFFYKASNTLDSMVGYKNERYLYFGRASALIDDVLNYIPARITGLLMCLSAWILPLDGRGAWRVYKRDHKKSSSPNAGHPESAVAGALGVELLGDAIYFGEVYKKATIGDPKRPIEAKDIERTNQMMAVTTVLALVLMASLRAILFLWILK